MGNCSTRMKPIKLVGSKGELKLISAPITAAELMLDSPGYAVAPVEALRLTRRITAVKAEEVLEGGKAYLMVPVDRVGSRVSDIQLAAVERSVFGGGKKKGVVKRRRLSGSKVLPEVKGVGVKSFDLGGGCRRGRYGQPWSPVLEPILEA